MDRVKPVWIETGVQEPNKVLVKDQNYFRDKSWNNPYTISDKFYKYYHKQKVFVDKDCLQKDKEWRLKQTQDSNASRNKFIISNKKESKEEFYNLVKNRFELQKFSGQAIFSEFYFNNSEISNFIVNNQNNCTYNNPKTLFMANIGDNLWNKVTKLNNKRLKMIITPRTLKKEEILYKHHSKMLEKEAEKRKMIHQRAKDIRLRINPSNKGRRRSQNNVLNYSKFSRMKKFDEPQLKGTFISGLEKVQGVPNNEFINRIYKLNNFSKNLKNQTLAESTFLSKSKTNSCFYNGKRKEKRSSVADINEKENMYKEIEDLSEFDKKMCLKRKESKSEISFLNKYN